MEEEREWLHGGRYNEQGIGKKWDLVKKGRTRREERDEKKRDRKREKEDWRLMEREVEDR
jgi:hypothetical protein